MISIRKISLLVESPLYRLCRRGAVRHPAALVPPLCAADRGGRAARRGEGH